MPRQREPGAVEDPVEVVVEGAPADIAEVIEPERDTADPRTPGLKLLPDGQIEYRGKVYAVPFQTTAGCIVPPIWPKKPEQP